MGVNLGPIVPRKILELSDLRGLSFALDASIELYQFLALIRKPDGEPLMDSEGRITSHLVGLLFRSTRLMAEYGMRFIYIFDGEPHPLKKRVLSRRREVREKALKEWKHLISVGDFRRAWSKAVVSASLTSQIIEDAKRLLDLMGIPYVISPSDAEAQAAYYARTGFVWACASKDYDSMLYGATRLVRYITIQGTEYLPSRGILRSLKPELIELEETCRAMGLSREQLVDLALIIGTDYNEGLSGIGPKKALHLIRQYRTIENMPNFIKEKLESNYQEIREIFLKPRISEIPPPDARPFDEEKLLDFLVNQRNFNKERVLSAIERLKKAREMASQESLSKYFH